MIVLSSVLLGPALAEVPLADPLARGQDLFLRTWLPGDPRVTGDGLGPLYNEHSCVACHAQGGVGGSGGAHADVLLRVSTVAPGSPPEVTVVHRYGGTDGGRATARRSTPALFGAGLVDAIPARTIVAGARRKVEGFPEITGEVPRVGDDVGRFGWKGDVATLSEFVVKACAVELGLDSLGGSQAGPMASRPDLERADVDALTAYVAALPPPVEEEVPGAAEGRTLFAEIGCTACHQERLGEVEGLYSDLLLHDLGGALADPIAGYYGQGAASGALVARAGEWRTPPLWGLRDSAPYLHDGRAPTVADAIALHAGEAQEVVDRYFALAEPDAAHLQAFLMSLAVPRS